VPRRTGLATLLRTIVADDQFECRHGEINPDDMVNGVDGAERNFG
jgi:hypothetical protein